jgi:hypothetical protein
MSATTGEHRVDLFVDGAFTSFCTAGVGALLAFALETAGTSAVVGAMVAGGCYFGANEMRAHIRETFFSWPEALIGTTRVEFVDEVYLATYGQLPSLDVRARILEASNRFISVNTVSSRVRDPQYSPAAIAAAVAEVARKAKEAADKIAADQAAIAERAAALKAAQEANAKAAPAQQAFLRQKAAGMTQALVVAGKKVPPPAAPPSSPGPLVLGGLAAVALGIILARRGAR